MVKLRSTIDVSKFRKDVVKSIDGISLGFESDPNLWISTGNYVLNYLISGDFQKGIPMGRVTMLAGESGSGKSYIASANIVRNAQAQGVFVVLIDTEHALDEEWLARLGVDTAEDKFLRAGISLVDDVVKFISDFMKGFKVDHGDKPLDEQPAVLFVIDSLGMLMTRTEIDQAEKGDIKGDMGRKAKAFNHLVKYCNSMFEKYNIGMVSTNHTYESQDMFNPDPKISGGNGFIFASSVVIAMRKGKMKDAEKKVNGIRAMCSVVKTRFNHKALFKKVEIEIPFETGMDEYSGMFELMEKQGFLLKEGYSYVYKGNSGTFKAKEANITPEQYQMMMKDHPDIFRETTNQVIPLVVEA